MSKPFMEETVSGLDVAAAALRLAGQVHRTLVATSRTLDRLADARVFLKCENLQRAGAFKYRGACNAIARLGDAERRRGVIAYSSGNHAQAVALAAREAGVKALIVMPADAPRVKLSATRDYGAEVVLYNPASERREAVAARLQAERGLTLIPPYDHPHIIAGQGTAALELFEDQGPLDFLLVPCGGGGLLSGSALAARQASPGCRVVGVEPEAGDDATRSFHSRSLQSVENPRTIADGARTPSLGRHTFPLVLTHVHAMVTVSDQEIIDAMAFAWERLKLVVEPTGALALAALLAHRFLAPGARVGVILSGGNVDLVEALKLFQQRG